MVIAEVKLTAASPGFDAGRPKPKPSFERKALSALRYVPTMRHVASAPPVMPRAVRATEKVYDAALTLLAGSRFAPATKVCAPFSASAQRPANDALGAIAIAKSAVKPDGKLTVERALPARPEIARRR